MLLNNSYTTCVILLLTPVYEWKEKKNKLPETVRLDQPLDQVRTDIRWPIQLSWDERAPRWWFTVVEALGCRKGNKGDRATHTSTLKNTCDYFLNENVNVFDLFGKVVAIGFMKIKMVFCWFSRKRLKLKKKKKGPKTEISTATHTKEIIILVKCN